MTNLHNGIKTFSLVARWIPREKSKKFGWLYYYLAMNYSQHEIPSDVTHPSYERAVNRAFMVYRKNISKLRKRNSHLEKIYWEKVRNIFKTFTCILSKIRSYAK